MTGIPAWVYALAEDATERILRNTAAADTADQWRAMMRTEIALAVDRGLAEDREAKARAVLECFSAEPTDPDIIKVRGAR